VYDKISMTERILSIISSLITIIQLIISFPIILGGELPEIYSITKDYLNVPTRVVIVVILEATTAYFSGLLYKKVDESFFSVIGFRNLMILVISLLTTWVSIFNLQYILIGRKLEIHELVFFILLVAASDLLSGIFLWFDIEDSDFVLGIFTTRSLCYLMLYISLFFQ